MSTAYVSEYAQMAGTGPHGIVQAPIGMEPSADQKITFTGTYGISAAFGDTTKFVRVHVDGIAAVVFSAPPGTAATTTVAKRMAAGQTEYFGVKPGWFVSFITTT